MKVLLLICLITGCLFSFYTLIDAAVYFLGFKKRLQKFGSLLYKLPNDFKNKYKVFVFFIIAQILIIVLVVFMMVMTKSVLPLLFVFLFFPLTGIVYKAFFTSKYNGIYENGIISDQFIELQSIESYSICDSKVILNLKNNYKISLRLPKDGNFKIDYFEKNKIFRK